jgi:serine/threonine-protein kinase
MTEGCYSFVFMKPNISAHRALENSLIFLLEGIFVVERILLKPGITIRGRWYGGEYRVIKLIGSGGTARVYLVRDLSDGRKYALKLGSDMAGVEREYKVLSSLSSIDYVPRVYVRDDCTIEGRKRFFFIMDYLEGENLKKLCSTRRIPQGTTVEAAAITAVICLFLNHRGLYYCDIKPENLVFDKTTGNLYLVDFGGVVGAGQPVTQFTPAYDRAGWGSGQRVADESYQIFAILMMLVDLLLDGIPEVGRDLEALKQRVNKTRLSKGLKKVIIKGLDVENHSLKGLVSDLRRVLRMADGVGEGLNQCSTDFLINAGLAASVAFFIMVLVFIL